MNGKRLISLPIFTLCMLLVGPFGWVARAQELPPEVLRYADLVLYNGHVLTMDRDQPPITVVQAVAVREGRILAVGEDDRILEMAGPSTVKVDLEGKAVIPGIVDTHSHPNSYALRHYERELTPAYLKFLQESGVRSTTVRWETKQQALADFKRFAESVPPGEWIYTNTRGNDVALNQITRYDLDEVVPDHPLYVRIGNAMWGIANSKMLDIVTDYYGENLTGLLKDEQGVLTGRISGAAGTVIDQEVIPQTPPEILKPIFKKELEEWVAIGVTTLSTRLKGSEITAYGQLDREGELPLRMGYSHEVGRENPFLERDLKRFGNLQGHGTDWIWMIGISIGIPDGNGPAGAGRSCTTVPKKEILPTDLYPEGYCFWEMPGEPGAEAIIAASRYGYRISGTHTFGDRGFLMILDAYAEANQENSLQGRRFSLDHGLMVSPEVLAQAAKHDVIWSFQPPQFYARYAAGVSRVFGEEYAHRWMMPVKSIIDAGMRVTYGADTHDDPERHPLFNLEVLVTRKIKDGRVFGPRERIDRSTALLMMTRWGADYVLREKELGSLEPGKLADLVVLDKNPLDRSIPDEALSDIKVLSTIIGGEVVYGSLH
ncbi:amidohydrolase family protein [Acidobacteria bacterium AH-259-D05]|nr:amidohydrolase family protein [Acidobacteria bacterium AH-259-D05]